jgi:hypothetical protein
MYEQPSGAELSQGDILDDCPILVWKLAPPPIDLAVPPEARIIRVVVLTQACDLAQDKTTRVVVAPVHEAAELVARNILKAGAIRDQVRRGQVFGWYFLPAAPAAINLGNRSWTCASCTRSNGAPWSIWQAPASASAAFGPPGESIWPSISAPLTRGLPCPNLTSRSRDSRVPHSPRARDAGRAEQEGNRMGRSFWRLLSGRPPEQILIHPACIVERKRRNFLAIP